MTTHTLYLFSELVMFCLGAVALGTDKVEYASDEDCLQSYVVGGSLRQTGGGREDVSMGDDHE